MTEQQRTAELAHAIRKRDECIARRARLVNEGGWSTGKRNRYMKHDRNVVRWVRRVRKLKEASK